MKVLLHMAIGILFTGAVIVVVTGLGIFRNKL